MTFPIQVSTALDPTGLPLQSPAGRKTAGSLRDEQKKNVTLGRILQTGLLPNLIRDDLDPEQTVEAAIAAGVRAVEVSCRRVDTVPLIKRMRLGFPELAVGVSSLIEDGPYYRFLQERGPHFPSIEEAVDAGAEFLVSYIGFSPATYLRYAHLPIIPGVDTADEAKRQLDLGASLVKFSNVPAAALRVINGAPIHSGLPLLATGGIRPEHLMDFVAAGTLACVCGFDLILGERYKAMQQQFHAPTVQARVADYVSAFAEARRAHRPGVDFSSGDAQLIQRQSGQFMNLPLTREAVVSDTARPGPVLQSTAVG